MSNDKTRATIMALPENGEVFLHHHLDATELKRFVAHLEGERDKWRMALESLTPMGSEFVNDLDRCLNYIIEQRGVEHRRAVDAVIARKRVGVENAELEKKAKGYRDIAEQLIAAFDERPEGEPEEFGRITRECAMSVAKKDLGWACVDCGRSVSCDYQLDNFIQYDESFIVCKPCHDQTNRDWEADKKMLREQGHQIPCDFFERLEKAAALRGEE